MGKDAQDLGIWQQKAKEILHLVPQDAGWLNDDELRIFFLAESHPDKEGKRLSDGAKGGLW